MWAGGGFVSCPCGGVFFVFFFKHRHCYNPISCIDVAPLIKFLKEIEDGTIVMMASFDDASTK